MERVYFINAGTFNALGDNTLEVYQNILAGQQAIRLCTKESFDKDTFFAAPLYDAQYERLQVLYPEEATLVERMAYKVIDEAMAPQAQLLLSNDFQLYLSSTKGNITNLGTDNASVLLQHLGKKIQQKYQLHREPIIVSSACISGTSALILAQRALQTQWATSALVVGVDAFTPFVYKGFQSFQALSKTYCRPFDAQRTGINLGEAAAAILLSVDKQLLPQDKPVVVLAGGGMTNDANHLSGPSRTGAELGTAILKAMQEANLQAEDLTMISAHGTATLYNDEMESKAIHYAGLANANVYSLKSYIGHTLGAAGVIESIIGIYALQHQMGIASLNFEETGTPMPLHIISSTKKLQHQHFLKTASGFGGCNAAVVFSRIEKV